MIQTQLSGRLGSYELFPQSDLDLTGILDVPGDPNGGLIAKRKKKTSWRFILKEKVSGRALLPPPVKAPQVKDIGVPSTKLQQILDKGRANCL